MRIEPATVMHLPWLRLLFVRWSAEFCVDYPTIDEEEYDNFVITISRNLTSNPDFYMLIAIVGRRVVGFLGGEIVHRPIGKPHRVGRAHWLYVIPKHRSKGVARQLIAAGLQWLATRDIDVVELSELSQKNAGDWERRGFEPFLTNYYLSTANIFQNLSSQSVLSNGHDHLEAH